MTRANANTNDLFASRRADALKSVEPLAARMRPRTLDEFVGQRHILGDGTNGSRPLLRRMIEGGTLSSILLHGPPGTGKTTLAEVIARAAERRFVRENAAGVGVARVREICADARRRIEEGASRTVLFLDEIHRFSKSQQDVLLADVERGIITLIGATTENPMFSVNSALVSRSVVFRLESLSDEDVMDVVRRALADAERGFGEMDVQMADDALAHLAKMSDGDARRALTALEIAVRSLDDGSGAPIRIGLDEAAESIQRKAIVYDRDGDQHYDHASALIKSVRGCDPDAAVYWLALMLEAGEDARFIARRLAILASEDIGNADPRAIMVAEATWSLVERIGPPEERILLSQCVTYLALAPKSNASYVAINKAMADVREGKTVGVPGFLRDKHKTESVGSTKDGTGYEYSHNAEIKTSIGGVTKQSYLGDGRVYYEPTEIGFDKLLKERLEEVKRARGGR